MSENSDADAIRDWWRTSIIDMAPGRIAFRGQPIEGLIGNVGFAQMIWLMTRGDLPSPRQAALLECEVDPVRWLDLAQQAETKQKLRGFTEQARALGIFGAPSFVVDGEMFWGDDRLEDAIAWATDAKR